MLWVGLGFVLLCALGWKNGLELVLQCALSLGSVYCVIWVGLGLELVLQYALSWSWARCTV